MCSQHKQSNGNISSSNLNGNNKSSEPTRGSSNDNNNENGNFNSGNGSDGDDKKDDNQNTKSHPGGSNTPYQQLLMMYLQQLVMLQQKNIIIEQQQQLIQQKELEIRRLQFSQKMYCKSSKPEKSANPSSLQNDHVDRPSIVASSTASNPSTSTPLNVDAAIFVPTTTTASPPHSSYPPRSKFSSSNCPCVPESDEINFENGTTPFRFAPVPTATLPVVIPSDDALPSSSFTATLTSQSQGTTVSLKLVFLQF